MKQCQLMASIRQTHQLRLVVYPFIPIFYKVYAFQVMQDFFHQQYDLISKDSNKIEASMGILQRKIILKPLETIGNQQIISELNHLCDSNPVRSPQECNLEFASISASTSGELHTIHNVVCLPTYKPCSCHFCKDGQTERRGL